MGLKMRPKDKTKKLAAIAGMVALGAMVVFFLKAGVSSYGIKGSFQNLTAAVTKPLYQAAAGIQKGFRGIFRFKEVTAENETLKKEMRKLQLEKRQLALIRQEKEELEKLQAFFQCEGIEDYQAAAANVAAMDYSGWPEAFTIDRGSRKGIRTGCAVVSGDGLAGRVIQVSEKTAKVASLLSEGNKVSFQTSGAQQQTGVIQSNGRGGLEGYLLGEDEGLKEGDELFTSSIGTYPQGLKIGVITHIEKKKGTQRTLIAAKPAVSFFNLKKVAVIL